MLGPAWPRRPRTAGLKAASGRGNRLEAGWVDGVGDDARQDYSG